MFDWVKLALLLLQLANKIVDRRRERGLLQEGEERAYAKQLVENARQTKIIKEIEERLLHATPEEILTELEGDFRD